MKHYIDGTQAIPDLDLGNQAVETSSMLAGFDDAAFLSDFTSQWSLMIQQQDLPITPPDAPSARRYSIPRGTGSRVATISSVPSQTTVPRGRLSYQAMIPRQPTTPRKATGTPIGSMSQPVSNQAPMVNLRGNSNKSIGMVRRHSADGIRNQRGPTSPAAKRQRKATHQVYFDGDPLFNMPSHLDHSSSDTDSTQCCSSCSEGVPCEAPDCEVTKEALVPCMEPGCQQPLCPDECLSETIDRRQGTLSNGIVPSSVRLSDWNYTAWNPQLQRSSSPTSQAVFEDSINADLAEQAGDISRPMSALPTTPSMAYNMDTPFSPTTAMATPQPSTNSPTVYANGSGQTLSGTGMRFDPHGSQWDEQNFKPSNPGDGSLMTSCAWSGCSQPFANQQEWAQHIHQAHVDPQMTFDCPLPTDKCLQNISHNPVHHLELDHGFDFSINSEYSCPAPDCGPDQTFLNPMMLHNHFDQAHATPASGSLLCQWNSCDTTFPNPHELFAHLNENHHLANLISTDADEEPIDPMPTQCLGDNPDAESSDDDKSNRCKWKTGFGSVCGAVHQSESDLQKHIKEAHLKSLNNRVGYYCQWEGCGRLAKRGNKSGFSARGKLERHMATHTGCKLW